MLKLGDVRGYFASLAAVALISCAIALINTLESISNISMLYLLAVIAIAVAYGQGAAILTSVASFLAYDFFFIDHKYTLTVSEASEWFALLLLLVTAIITGQLAARQRLRAEEAEDREREAALLYDIARLVAESDSPDALRAVAERLCTELSFAGLGIELRKDGRDELVAAVGSASAQQAVRSATLASFSLLREGAGPTATEPAETGRWVRAVRDRRADGAALAGKRQSQVVPIRTHDARLGSLVIVPDGRDITPSEIRVLSGVAAQIGAAIERTRYAGEAAEAEVLRRTDELRTALINAVSHDFRTPLASILASAESLLQTDVRWSADERREFAQAIEQEARRLNRLVGNLLDLSRIESGSLRPEKGWYDLSALVGEVLGRLRALTAGHRLVLSLAEDLPPVSLDYIETDEVISNLIENAVKHTPPNTEIGISTTRTGQELIVEVSDCGPGIPPEDIERVFQAFYRVSGSRVPGAGLGLAVAKGLVEAHGGRIWAKNGSHGGAVFGFALPLAPSEQTPPSEARQRIDESDPWPTDPGGRR